MKKRIAKTSIRIVEKQGTCRKGRKQRHALVITVGTPRTGDYLLGTDSTGQVKGRLIMRQVLPSPQFDPWFFGLATFRSVRGIQWPNKMLPGLGRTLAEH